MKTETRKDENGIIRFSSNNQIPFADYLQENHDLDDADLARHAEIRSNEKLELIRQMRAASPMTEDEKAERAYELRAAFGPGAKIVNILTGESFTS